MNDIGVLLSILSNNSTSIPRLMENVDLININYNPSSN
jgi:hypothetical protein